MGFLQPLALFGLAAAAIPAILHLMTRRVPPVVSFPAVRYIEETERVHSRRLKLRNLLLLVLRTLLIVLIVLAASRPVARLGFGTDHPPTAVALVIDNSLSSSAVVAGRPMLDRIKAEARRVLAMMGEDDELFVITADGIPTAASPREASTLLDRLEVSAARLDLGAAVGSAVNVLRRSGLERREVILISDGQLSAFTTAEDLGDVRLTVWRAPDLPVNRYLDAVRAEPEVWQDGGTVVAEVGGSGESSVAVSLELAGELAGRTVAGPGDQVALKVTPSATGWLLGTVALDADELRGDDVHPFAVLVADPMTVTLGDDVGAFVREAVTVLIEGQRLRRGSEVRIDTRAFPEPTIVVPPSDAATLGVTNRSLAQVGATWRFGEEVRQEGLIEGDVPVAGATVTRRYGLEGTGDVLATVNGAPWIVRSGSVVLLGSRLELGWTTLPVSAAFVPFVDFMVNRVMGRAAWMVEAVVGASVDLPEPVTELVGVADGETLRVTGPGPAPAEPGVYMMLASSTDTVGALVVTTDPRESRLKPATDGQIAAALAGANVVRDLEAVAFAGTGRADLTPYLLALAIVLAVAELLVATLGSRSSEA